MEEDEIQRKVFSYLRKKGFTKTELALQEERNRISASSSSDLPVSRLEKDPSCYIDGYSRLRAWVHSLRELYKHEILHVLYPVYIQCFMDLVSGGFVIEAQNFFCKFRQDHELIHSRDLQKIEGILSPTHSEEIQLDRSYRQKKFRIKMSEYSYDLLQQHLQKTQSFSILGMINEHINFEVFPGIPSSIPENTDSASLEGKNNNMAKQMNQKDARWGLLEDSEYLGRVFLDSDKVESENKEVNAENNKRTLDGAKQGNSVKKAKKDKLGSTMAKNVRSEASAVSVAPPAKAELTLPVTSAKAEQAILENLRNRVQLNSLALPSINFYTITNASDRLNCLSISQDGSLVVGGFSDSSLKVWDISRIDQSDKKSCLDEYVKNENLLPDEDCKKSYTSFHGHSGPVYSSSFSPLGDFVLSSSSDSTSKDLPILKFRLWSTKLNANLVCYKAHNYPVWDVQFGPVGHYFASSSHDRTARIWSVERIHPLRIMAGHLSDVDCVRWHPNCNYIATGSSDKTVRLWDVQAGECARIFIGHRNMIMSLAMSPNGQYMASGDEDGTIMIWDLSSGRCVLPLIGHSSCVWSLDFSCEGTVLASGSADCTLKLWDVTASTKAPRTENKSSSANRTRLLKAFPTKSSVHALQFARRNLLLAAGPSKCL